MITLVCENYRNAIIDEKAIAGMYPYKDGWHKILLINGDTIVARIRQYEYEIIARALNT